MKKNKVKAYYEGEADDYDRMFYLEDDRYPTLRYRHNYMLKMVEAIELAKDAVILDVGCGPGEMVMDLVQEERVLYGIDIAQEMVDRAKGRLAKVENLTNQVHLSVGDIENLDFEDNQFDLIICSGVIEYLSDDVKWLKEINRVLKKDGHLIINVTNKYSVRRWTAGMVEGLKKVKPMKKMMDFTKSKILGRGKLHHFPFKPRVHSPKGFDRFLVEKGYEKISHNYFDFSFFPSPIDTLLSPVTLSMKRGMERYSTRKMVLNGTGYIVSAKKIK